MNRKKLLALGLAVLMLLLCLAGCGNSIKSQLVGSWYLNGETTYDRDGKEGPALILYSDGTCVIASEYGTGTWALVNENQLKLTSFYGESEAKTIESLKNGCLTLEGGLMYLNSAR